LTGHEDKVTSVAFSPDGKTVLSGSDDNTLKLWEVATGREIRTLTGHGNDVNSVAFSPDGKTVLSGSIDKTLKLWEVATGREIRTLTGHEDKVTSVAFSPDGKKVLSGSWDRTLKLWEVASGQLLATLMSFDEDHWAVTTPDGRYDSSNNGETPYLHWVVGNISISLDQLKDRYYEPGLLAKVMGFIKEPLRPIPKLEDALVKLFPEVTAKVSETRPNRLDITLTDQGGGIGPVRVRINGKVVVEDARAGKALTSKTAQLAVDIDPAHLLPGDNAVEVLAWNRDEILRSWPARLTLNGLAARGGKNEDVAPQPAVPPTLYAIVVGTSRYAAPAEAKMNLAYSGKDALDMAQALRLGGQRLFGVDKVNLHLFSDQPGGDADKDAKAPSKAAIEAAFQQVAKEAKSTDLLLVYLSGHGVMSPGLDAEYHYLSREAQSLNLSDPTVRKLWAISGSELTQWVQRIKTAKQVMILDTCAAGGAVEKLSVQKSLSGDQIRALDRLHERSGFHILAGSAADKVSYEATRYGQGLLTHALLTGMKGAALREGEYIDVAKLFEYSSDQVPALAKGVGGVQRPQLFTVRGSSFDIGRLDADGRRQVPLSDPRPMLIRANFFDEQDDFDVIKLTQRFNRRLAEENLNTARGGLGFVDTDEFPEAWFVNGRYEILGDGVKLRVKLFLDGKRMKSLEVILPVATDKQVEPLLDAIRSTIADQSKT